MKQLSLSSHEFDQFENMIEIIIKGLSIVIIDNHSNTTQLQLYVDTIQEFYFVKGWTDLLINIFKSKDYEINRKEIHSEIMYKRIYEIEKFRRTIMYFVMILQNNRDYKVIRILRKLWIINENSFPLVQNEIFTELYYQNNFDTRYNLIFDSSDSLIIEFKDLRSKRVQSISIQELFDSKSSK